MTTFKLPENFEEDCKKYEEYFVRFLCKKHIFFEFLEYKNKTNYRNMSIRDIILRKIVQKDGLKNSVLLAFKSLLAGFPTRLTSDFSSSFSIMYKLNKESSSWKKYLDTIVANNKKEWKQTQNTDQKEMDLHLK